MVAEEKDTYEKPYTKNWREEGGKEDGRGDKRNIYGSDSTLRPTLTHCLYRVCILSYHSKGSLEVMVDLVDMLVELAVMQQLMYPVVPGVLQD